MLVRGGAGKDVLKGGNADDILYGFGGHDTLTGGGGVQSPMASSSGGQDCATAGAAKSRHASSRRFIRAAGPAGGQ